MLHQLRDGNWIDPDDVRSLVARDRPEEHPDVGPRVTIGIGSGFPPGADWSHDVSCGSFDEACAYRDELAALANLEAE